MRHVDQSGQQSCGAAHRWAPKPLLQQPMCRQLSILSSAGMLIGDLASHGVQVHLNIQLPGVSTAQEVVVSI